MEHSFNIDDAKKYGINEAVLLNNIRFWIAKNKANGKHFYDGFHWTYNSVKAFSELFPYLTEHQIRRALENLERLNIIKSGNYNASPYDKTKWYCIISQTDLANLPKGEGKKPKPISDSKPDDENTDKSLYQLAVDFWLNEFHSGWNFKAVHGKKMKSILEDLTRRLKSSGKSCEDSDVLDAFKKFCLNLPPFYQDKDLSILESKMNEIIEEIKKKKDTEYKKANNPRPFVP